MSTGVTQASGVSAIGIPGSFNAKLPPSGYRTALIGDSYFGQGFYFLAVATGAGNFVVSNGIATITAANHLLIPGNYVALFNNGDTTFATALNGVTVPVISTPTNNTFTVSATYNGVTMANGDYSNPFGSGQWYVYNVATSSDSSHYRYHNYFNNGMFVTTNMSAFIFARTDQILTLMPKILNGPSFDVAFVNMGANDIALANASTTSQAITAAQFALGNTINVCNQLGALGKLVFLVIPCPVGTGLAAGNIQSRNIGMAQLRRGLLKYSAAMSFVRIIDAFQDAISGTAANGDFAANFGFTDGIHLSTYGCYQVAKYENQKGTFNQIISKNVDNESLTILEDAATYAQSFPAWVANTAYAFATSPAGATVPTYVRNGYSLYALANAGTSAPSGGPAGTGSAIVDGTCIWNYQGSIAFNFVPHGLMDGTTAVNAATGFTSLTGTMPTGWTFQNNPTGAVASCVSTGQAVRAASNSTGAGNIASAANSNQANGGYGWNLVITWGAIGNIVSVQCSDMSALLANDGVALHAMYGGWYRFGFTVNANGAVAGVANINGQFLVGTGGVNVQVNANRALPNTTSMPMSSGDQIQIVSEPFFIPAGQVQGVGVFTTLTINIQSSAASGTANLQLESAWLRPTENPFAPTLFGVT